VELQRTSTAAVIGVRSDDNPGASRRRGGAGHGLTLDLEPFAWEALEQEAARQGVTVQELACFAIDYYLADGDSGRIARRLPPGHPVSESHPLGKLLGG
jgi:hypothetical protein